MTDVNQELCSELDEILSPAAVADPYGFLGRLRESDPVHWNARYRSWVLTRHEDVGAAMSDPRLSSDRISPAIARERRKERPDLNLVETLELLNGWLVFRDPPEHTRFRRLVHKAFSPRIIAAMRSEVERIADELLDEARAKAGQDGVIDLVQEVAYPLPAIVIASMLGVPSEDRVQFKNWSDDISALVFGAMEDPDRHGRAQSGMVELVGYIGALLERVRAEPGDDLASALVQARDGEEALTQEELVAICVNLLFGGHETTTNLIANSVLALVRHPDQAALLRDEPSLASKAVEELLRYDGPAKAVVRLAAEDVEMGGRTIKRGDRVFLMLSGANHDPEVFDDPERLDLLRDKGAHLAFGIGVHYCLGATLARLEASIVIPRVLQRFPSLALADQDLEWNAVILTRGLKRLLVRLGDAEPDALGPASLFSMRDRVAVVTGGSSGLGVQFARTLAAAGADIVLAARRADQLRDVAGEIEVTGRRCVTVPTDVARQGDCAALIEAAVAELGDVHVLVNNAGTSRTRPAHHEEPEDFTSVIDVNLTGAYYMAQAFARHCIAAGHPGSIVNIASVLAISGGPTPQAGYSASKAGLLGLTRDLAVQWSGRKGIRVNALAPGYFASEMTGPLLEDPERTAEVTGRTVLGRLGEPEELAGALLLLASDAGSYITGVTLAVDGGWTLH